MIRRTLLLSIKVALASNVILFCCFSTGYSQQLETVFFEGFENNINEWAENDPTNPFFLIQHNKGSVLLEQKTANTCSATEKYIYIGTDKHFSIEVGFSKTAGIQNNGYGLVWGMKSGNSLYQFLVSGDGHFTVSKINDGAREELVPWTQHKAVRQGNGATNNLKILKNGDETVFLINDQEVKRLPFSNFFGHKVGFKVCDKQTIAIDFLEVKVEREHTFDLSKEGYEQKPLFAETFSNNDNNWPSSSNTSENASFKLMDGRYHFAHKRNENSWLVYKSVQADPGKDFMIQTLIKKESGILNNGYGLVFGREDNDNQYEFILSGDGYFKIFRYIGGEYTELQSWAANSNVNQGNGSENDLKVLKRGEKLLFYINNAYVSQVPYEGLPGNSIGYVIYKSQKIAADELNFSYLEAVTQNEPPLITITKPANTRAFFKTISTREVKVEGKVEDPDGIASVTVNDIPAQVTAEGIFSATVPLSLGNNELHVKATDLRQKTGYESFQIIRKEKEAKKEKRLALVIGNQAYTHAGSLKNPINDAQALKKGLEQVGFDVLIYENCGQILTKKAIDEFGQKLKDYQTGLLFYAGHGIQANGVNYMVPIDARLQNANDVEYECVRIDRVLAKMESAGSTTNVIVLDACRDNPFETSWSRSTSGSGLAFMNAPRGSLIAYATSPGDVASDGNGNHGLYTEALLEHLTEPGINILEMFQRVRGKVVEVSGGKQIPWESTSLTGSNFYLVPGDPKPKIFPQGEKLVSMGNKVLTGQPAGPKNNIFEYIIKTYTPTEEVMEYANTNETIKITLYGDKDNYETILNDPNKNDFEYGNWDEFPIKVGKDLGNLNRIEIIIQESDGNIGNVNGWYLQTLQIKDVNRNKEVTLQINQWLDDETGGMRLDRVIE